jgi:hypothetical protein
MSSSLNHYTADVQVTDAVMHNKTPLSTSTFTVAVLAANVTDAKALIQEFYGRTGMSSKIIDGVHTLYRAATPNVPGAIRTVTVTNVVLVTSPTAAVPVAVSTSAPAAVAEAPVDTAAPVVAATVAATPAPATSTATETTTAVPSVINATASPAATTAVTDTTTTTQQEVSAPTLKPGGRGRKTLTVDPSASTQTAAPVVAETTSSTTSAPTSSATAPAAS